jgi:hypothetical protein
MKSLLMSTYRRIQEKLKLIVWQNARMLIAQSGGRNPARRQKKK